MPAIVTSLIFYMQMRVEKKYKACAYINYRHFTQQCKNKTKTINSAGVTRYHLYPSQLLSLAQIASFCKCLAYWAFSGLLCITTGK